MINTQGKVVYWTPVDQGMNDRTWRARTTVSSFMFLSWEGYVIFLGGKLQAMGPLRH